jgi:hypothetical protein
VVEPTPIAKGKPRRYATRNQVARGESDFVGFRCSLASIRQMDEIVASRVEEELQTRSDVLQDAVVKWIDDFYKTHPGGSGRTAWTLYRSRALRERRESDLKTLVEEIEIAGNDHHVTQLNHLLVECHRMKSLFDSEEASPREKKDLQHALDRLKQLQK